MHKAAPWYEYFTSFHIVVIEIGITTVGSCAFTSCQNLTLITIPNNVTTIGMSAFHGCSTLTLITNLNPVPVQINPNVFMDVNQSA